MESKFIFEGKEYLELEICSQSIFNGDWILLKRLKRENRHYALIKCGFCGKEKIVGWYQTISSTNLRTCKNCGMQSKARDRIGKIIGIIKILELDHVERFEKGDSTDLRIYYKTQCLLCGHESIRLYNLPQWKKLSKCKHCDDDKKFSSNPFINKIYKNYKESAATRGYSWELTDEQFLSLLQQSCFYCGNEPTQRYVKYGRKNGKKLSNTSINGIDRMDSSKGYCIDNCVPCCSTCNYMKQSFSQDYFFNQINKIYNYQKNIKGSETISKESTPQANGGGNRECPIG